MGLNDTLKCIGMDETLSTLIALSVMVSLRSGQTNLNVAVLNAEQWFLILLPRLSPLIKIRWRRRITIQKIQLMSY